MKALILGVIAILFSTTSGSAFAANPTVSGKVLSVVGEFPTDKGYDFLHMVILVTDSPDDLGLKNEIIGVKCSVPGDVKFLRLSYAWLLAYINDDWAEKGSRVELIIRGRHKGSGVPEYFFNRMSLQNPNSDDEMMVLCLQ